MIKVYQKKSMEDEEAYRRGGGGGGGPWSTTLQHTLTTRQMHKRMTL